MKKILATVVYYIGGYVLTIGTAIGFTVLCMHIPFFDDVWN